MNKEERSIASDFIVMSIGVVIIILTIIIFIDGRASEALLPYIFTAGSIWVGINAGSNISASKKILGFLCIGFSLLLLALAIIGYLGR